MRKKELIVEIDRLRRCNQNAKGQNERLIKDLNEWKKAYEGIMTDNKTLLKSYSDSCRERRSLYEKYERALKDKETAVKACRKYREELRSVKEQAKILEDNMGALLVQREEDNKYYRRLDDDYRELCGTVNKALEINGYLGGRLSKYEDVKIKKSTTRENGEASKDTNK